MSCDQLALEQRPNRQAQQHLIQILLLLASRCRVGYKAYIKHCLVRAIASTTSLVLCCCIICAFVQC